MKKMKPLLPMPEARRVIRCEDSCPECLAILEARKQDLSVPRSKHRWIEQWDTATKSYRVVGEMLPDGTMRGS